MNRIMEREHESVEGARANGQVVRETAHGWGFSFQQLRGPYP